jgi:hypothetical protein
MRQGLRFAEGGTGMGEKETESERTGVQTTEESGPGPARPPGPAAPGGPGPAGGGLSAEHGGSGAARSSTIKSSKSNTSD